MRNDTQNKINWNVTALATVAAELRCVFISMNVKITTSIGIK